MAKIANKRNSGLNSEVIKAQIHGNTIRSFFKYACITACVYFFYLTIDSLSGKMTNANFFVDVLADLKASQYFAYAFGISGISYGTFQHRLRKRNIQRIGSQKSKLEKLLDINKISTHLKINGDSEEGSEL